MKKEIQDYITQIQKDYTAWMCGDDEVSVEMREEFIRSIDFTIGRKYIKFDTGGSVHSFIVNTDKDKKFKKGDILKAASWAAPARNFARGNIYNPEDIEKIRWTGV